MAFGFNLTKKLKPFVLHADAIYSFPQKVRVDGIKTHYDNYLNYDFAAEYFLPYGLNLLLEANGFLQGDMKEDGKKIYSSDERYLIISPGIGWSCEKIKNVIVYQRVAPAPIPTRVIRLPLPADVHFKRISNYTYARRIVMADNLLIFLSKRGVTTRLKILAAFSTASYPARG
jgi:hypothetical protein